MAINLPLNPTDGDVYNISAGRKIVFQSGRWKLFVNNVPYSQQIAAVDHQPYVSTTVPPTSIPEAFWYNPSTGELSFKITVDSVVSWETFTPTAAASFPTVVQGITPAVTVPEFFWYNSDLGILYFKKDASGVLTWEKSLSADALAAAGESAANAAIAAQKAAVNGIASLIGGKVDPLQLPSYAVEIANAITAAIVAQKADANGLASLVDGIVPSTQLPGYVDEVLEYPTRLDFPAVGLSGKIYIDASDLTTGGEYRWTGSDYFELNKTPGTSDGLAEGTINRYFTAAREASVAADAQAKANAAQAAAVSTAAGDATAKANAAQAAAATDATAKANAAQAAAIAAAEAAVAAAGTGAATALPYDLIGSIFGIPADGEYVIRMNVGRAFKMPAGQANAQATNETAATATSVLAIYKDSTEIGSITFAPGSSVGVISFTTEVTFAVGNKFSIVCPATADATLGDIDITLVGVTV